MWGWQRSKKLQNSFIYSLHIQVSYRNGFMEELIFHYYTILCKFYNIS